MRAEQVHRWLSRPRFKPYLDACDADFERAAGLYDWNLSVSAAFMEVLGYVEVLLRNTIDRQFDQRASGSMVDPGEDWLTDPSILEEYGRLRVKEAIERLLGQGKEPTHDRVVASLSFGFWCALLAGRYEELWRSRLRRAFPAGDGRRKQVRAELSSILVFRNRVAHHEPVFSWDLGRQHERQLTVAGVKSHEVV